jgi:hypothetical protein
VGRVGGIWGEDGDNGPLMARERVVGLIEIGAHTEDFDGSFDASPDAFGRVIARNGVGRCLLPGHRQEARPAWARGEAGLAEEYGKTIRDGDPEVEVVALGPVALSSGILRGRRGMFMAGHARGLQVRGF